MSISNLLNHSDIDSSINSREISNIRETKTKKNRTRNNPVTNLSMVSLQDIDVRKDATTTSVDNIIVGEEHPNVALIKKPKKTTVRASADKIDTSSANNDNEEAQNISLKRKRGRPPKCKNEIVKSHWLGFFAFVAENGYFEVSK